MPTLEVGLSKAGKVEVKPTRMGGSGGVPILRCVTAGDSVGGVVLVHLDSGLKGRYIVEYQGGDSWYIDGEEVPVGDFYPLVVSHGSKVGVRT